MITPEVSAYFQGKGKSVKSSSSGKGFSGRRMNPIGSDGQRMKCRNVLPGGGVCGAEDHFAASCPRGGRPSGSAPPRTFLVTDPPPGLVDLDEGPLAGLLGDIQAAGSYMITDADPLDDEKIRGSKTIHGYTTTLWPSPDG